VVDERERPSEVPRLLKKLSLAVDFRMLETEITYFQDTLLRGKRYMTL